MDIENIRELVKLQLSTDRYNHTLRVTEVAIELAKRFDCNVEDVTIAALLHDCAKDKDERRLRELIQQYGLPEQLLDYDIELWHGPVASKIATERLAIKNSNIVNAIYYHTTGRAEMSLVELIVFVADYIEPARSFPGVDEVRENAQYDIIVAARNALKNTIVFLINKNVTIHPDTFLAYNDLTKKLGVK